MTTAATAVSGDAASNDDLDVDEIDSDGVVGDLGTEEESEPAGDVADWTVLVYVMGDNDLEPFAVQDLLEMSEVGSDDRVHIVALADRHPEYALDDDPLGDFTDTRLLRVEAGELIDIADPGELNLGDAGTLAAFIETGVTEFPAERYAVVLWNHGAGWPGMGPDETDGNDILDLADIDAGFSAGLESVGLESVDLIGFDACLMASYEVASVVAEHGDLMIASSELEPGHGWDYRSLEVLLPIPRRPRKNSAEASSTALPRRLPRRVPMRRSRSVSWTSPRWTTSRWHWALSPNR